MSLLSRRIERKIAAYQNELIATHFAEVENMYSQVRGWAHDYRNHMQVLSAYAEKGDLAAIRQYLAELDGDLAGLTAPIKTGNRMRTRFWAARFRWPARSASPSPSTRMCPSRCRGSKISLARAKRIPVTIDAHVPFALSVSQVDLCAILGNLFDNAIEATLPLPEEERMIRIYIDTKNTQLYISFTNTAAGGRQEKVGGLFRSTKGAGRGFGLKRVDAIVKRLGGYVSRNSEDGAFTTEILLPQ